MLLLHNAVSHASLTLVTSSSAISQFYQVTALPVFDVARSKEASHSVFITFLCLIRFDFSTKYTNP